MLSRLAESFFWMGRYLERCESTTRLLVEHHQLMVQEQQVTATQGSEVLLSALALDGHANDAASLVGVVFGSETEPSTILGSLAAARNNARSIRDAIPGDFFEALNKSYIEIIDHHPHPQFPGSDLRNHIERLAVISGVFEWVAPRDESFHFLQLGRSLERLDLTARLLTTRYEHWWPEQGPATMLRAVGGFNTFLRGRVPMTGDRVRAFLTIDETFPRSLVSSAQSAENSMRELSSLLGLRHDDVLRDIGLLRSQLEYSSTAITDQFVDEVVLAAMNAVSSTSGKVRDRFFRPVGTIVWSH